MPLANKKEEGTLQPKSILETLINDMPTSKLVNSLRVIVLLYGAFFVFSLIYILIIENGNTDEIYHHIDILDSIHSLKLEAWKILFSIQDIKLVELGLPAYRWDNIPQTYNQVFDSILSYQDNISQSTNEILDFIYWGKDFDLLEKEYSIVDYNEAIIQTESLKFNEAIYKTIKDLKSALIYPDDASSKIKSAKQNLIGPINLFTEYLQGKIKEDVTQLSSFDNGYTLYTLYVCAFIFPFVLAILYYSISIAFSFKLRKLLNLIIVIPTKLCDLYTEKLTSYAITSDDVSK